MLAYMGVRHMVHKRNMHRIERNQNDQEHYGGRHHRLGAAAQAEENTAYGQTLSAVSVAVWGLVVAKAKAGVDAAAKNDIESVGAMLKKVGVFCTLIAGASLLQMMGAANTTNPVEAVQAASSSHKLKAEHHPRSYYDENSSHYQGGAHNALVNSVKSGEFKLPTHEPEFGHEVLVHVAKQLHSGKISAKSSVLDKEPEFGHEALVHVGKKLYTGEMKRDSPIASQSSLGGAHNVALAVLTEQSNQFKRAREESKSNEGFSLFSLFGHKKHHHKQSREHRHKNLKHTGAFIGFIAILAICIGFYIKAKTYHDHLEKKKQLEDLMNNPNARVASGKKGKKVVDKIMKKTEESAEAPYQTSIDSMIKAAKAKKVEKKQAADQEAAINAY